VAGWRLVVSGVRVLSLREDFALYRKNVADNNWVPLYGAIARRS